jgi:hypothetical protein
MYDDREDTSRETTVSDPAAPLMDGVDGWDFISRYTRAQAIADGMLVDVSETAREAGIRFPVAATRAVWNEYVAMTEVAERAGNSERGRLWDVVWMLRFGMRQNRDESTFLFKLYVVTDSIDPSMVELKAVCDGGDDGKPVITVLLPDED